MHQASQSDLVNDLESLTISKSEKSKEVKSAEPKTIPDDVKSIPKVLKPKSNQRILLILDLNGTLVERVHSPKANQLLKSIPHTFTIPKYKVYGRPHLAQFISYILKEFDVAVWTSALEKNANGMCTNIFKDDLKQIKFVWNQAHCSEITAYPNFSCVKDLRTVWTTFPQYCEQKTIMIDDTCEKLKYNRKNGLIIPTFSVLENENHLEDSELLKLITYLTKLKNDDPECFGEYMQSTPFI
jgi:TFIIF-interacting CTD phosphatase-like protein